MNIYDEAIEIFKGTDTDRTQEEMLAIDNLFDVVKEEYLLLLSEDENNKIIQTLERAKKVEKELEELKRDVKILNDSIEFSFDDFIWKTEMGMAIKRLINVGKTQKVGETK